jgi:hypothetical protein
MSIGALLAVYPLYSARIEAVCTGGINPRPTFCEVEGIDRGNGGGVSHPVLAERSASVCVQKSEIAFACPPVKILSGVPDLVFWRQPVPDGQQLHNLTSHKLPGMNRT